MVQDAAVLDGLLPTETVRRLLEYVIAKEEEFGQSRVLNAESGDHGMVDARVRRNLHLKGPDSVPIDVLDAIKRAVPTLLVDLDIDRNCLEGAYFEAEITATRDGGFFRAHVDNGHVRVSDRLLTYVYFFSETPCPFRGGELCIERDWRSGDRIFFIDGSPADLGLPEDMVAVIEPRVNRLVIFRGDRMHEVRPVVTDSTRFGASRFTVTGWVRNGRNLEAGFERPDYATTGGL